MPNVILVCEMIPIQTKIYDLMVYDEEFGKLSKCHGLYLNASSHTGEQIDLLNWLFTFLEDKIPIYDSSKEEANKGIFIFGPYNIVVSGVVD